MPSHSSDAVLYKRYEAKILNLFVRELTLTLWAQLLFSYIAYTHRKGIYERLNRVLFILVQVCISIEWRLIKVQVLQYLKVQVFRYASGLRATTFKN